MTRYSTTEVRSIVDQIALEAKMAGLIPMAAFVSYHPGNVSQGISGYVDVNVQHADGQYENIRADFFPKFTYRMTRTDHARLLEAVLRVFFAFRRNREAADKL